ncbi:MAG: hypothetical protein KHZ87_05120 [Clostridiales bacterium]|nr:hypothetical protein [Clostridiales bacterium]MBS5878039.1 hypothetical protein [Clostridiales bacterium]MDU0939271.1 hypothetical protein [Clostridiales bacterium]MDU1042297.1 hypothetical protein [Clostridiales bacterium]MDU3490116.1 hypothetical protein [Clostridiales bacterium]
MNFGATFLWMMLIPAFVSIGLGIIIQIIGTVKKKRIAAGPVLIAAGVVFAVISLVVILPIM